MEEAASVSESLTSAPTIRRLNVDKDSSVITAKADTAATNPPTRAKPSKSAAIEWPAVPQHEPSAKIPVYTDAQQEETFPIALSTGVPMTTNNSDTTTTKEHRHPVPSFTFSGLDSAENTAFESKLGQKVGPSKVAEPATASEPRKRAPLKQKSVSTHNSILSQKNVPSKPIFSFGQAMPSSSFDFEVPSKLLPVAEKASSPMVAPATFRLMDEKADPEINMAQHSAEIRLRAISTEPSEDRPVTPVYKQPESFGYAVVTPPSTKYKTYLPARQQHGLMTPPETPEDTSQTRTSSSPSPSFEDPFAISFTPESPSPTVTRKPLPILPVPDAMPKTIENQVTGKPHASDIVQSEKVQSSCLSRLGLKRLRKSVLGKMKNVKERMSLSKEGTTSSTAS